MLLLNGQYNALCALSVLDIRICEGSKNTSERLTKENTMGLQATNAGIDFQQRVSAFMMILMEFEIDVSKVLGIINADEKIVKINFEACESVDDLVLTLESGKKIYFQTKRTISLSDDSSSEFYKVCKQFVSQYKKTKHLIWHIY